MERHAQLGDVRTWYAEYGTGEPAVLLHPGGADSRAWGPNLDALAARFTVFTPDRRGQGRTADVAGPVSYDLMAQDTAAFCEQVAGGPAVLVGCSDGAVVALLTALLRPDLVRRLVLVAGVFHRDGWAPGTAELDAAAVEFFTRLYAEVSPDGAGHYPVMAAKLDRMHAAEPALAQADLAGIRSRTLIMAGDDDEVALEHAVAMYRGIPDAELAIVPGTSHGLLVEKPDLCNAMMIDFLTTDPVPTIAPIRRAAPAPA
jgi:pimeloyl-ACP methyl ester carboxylesterase